MRETILRRPVLRPIYWILRRSAEVMLDEGPRGVAQRIGVKLRLALRGQYFLVKPRRPVDFNTQYNFWLRKHELTEAHRLAIEAAITSLPYTPRVSVLAVLDPCEESRLLSLLAVMRDQIYPYWELCVAIPPSADTTALSAATVTEPRLHIAKGHDPLPLHAAAQNGDTATSELLLAHGADPSIGNDDGKTAADFAGDAGHEELARRLRG